MKFESDKSIYYYSKFFRQGILMDTSPLIIYFLGEYDKKHETSLIEEWKKGNKSYTSLDYDYLKRFLGSIPFEKLCITPHIFHEFYKHLQKILNSRFYHFFNYNIDLLMRLHEKPVNKNDLMTHPYFDKLEIGEHSLYMIKEEEQLCAILTDDERKTLPIFRDNKEVLLVFIKDVINYMNNPL